jgi:hypothetical protein
MRMTSRYLRVAVASPWKTTAALLATPSCELRHHVEEPKLRPEPLALLRRPPLVVE